MTASGMLNRSGSQTSLGASSNKSHIVEEALRNLPSQHLVVSDLLKETEMEKVAEQIEKSRPMGTPIPMALSLPPTW